MNTAPIEKNKNLADREQRKTRREEMEGAGQDLEIPDVSAPFIISYLLEIGPVIAAGLGPAAISWQDIQAWQQCTSIQLPPWQSRLLVKLSRAYLSFAKKAEEPDCLSPLSSTAKLESRREAISKSLRIGFKSMMVTLGSGSRKRSKQKPGRIDK